MKAIVKYFPAIRFITLEKVVLMFESADEILKYDHSNESHCGIFSCGTVYHPLKVLLILKYADEILLQ